MERSKIDYALLGDKLYNLLPKGNRVMNEDDFGMFIYVFDFDENDEHLGKIIRWCLLQDLRKKDVYENNSYRLKHICEREIGEYVSNDEIALGFYRANKFIDKFEIYLIFSKEYANGLTYKIGKK